MADELHSYIYASSRNEELPPEGRRFIALRDSRMEWIVDDESLEGDRRAFDNLCLQVPLPLIVTVTERLFGRGFAALRHPYGARP